MSDQLDANGCLCDLKAAPNDHGRCSCTMFDLGREDLIEISAAKVKANVSGLPADAAHVDDLMNAAVAKRNAELGRRNAATAKKDQNDMKLKDACSMFKVTHNDSDEVESARELLKKLGRDPSKMPNQSADYLIARAVAAAGSESERQTQQSYATDHADGEDCDEYNPAREDGVQAETAGELHTRRMQVRQAARANLSRHHRDGSQPSELEISNEIDRLIGLQKPVKKVAKSQPQQNARRDADAKRAADESAKRFIAPKKGGAR